ncbi:MAG: hypothetical protein Gaeavirus7_13 [Gaeavirus sp.]|uniref:Leucine-rich repeat protein n=1 Tax=Gaeavirus sp. TaxID=2487767 RepID=A0A3G4ZYP8_9VIRU|nr:MAG: hypothetical protein Gaeavirus7_13 [Gaeavirus sp.]
MHKDITEESYKNHYIDIVRSSENVTMVINKDIVNSNIANKLNRIVFPENITILEYNVYNDVSFRNVIIPETLHTLRIRGILIIFPINVRDIVFPINLRTLELTYCHLKTKVVLPYSLHTLIMNVQHCNELFILPFPKNLRILCLPVYVHTNLHELPSELEELILLRMCTLKKDSVTNLPVALKKLMVIPTKYVDSDLAKTFTKIPYGCDLIYTSPGYYDEICK